MGFPLSRELLQTLADERAALYQPTPLGLRPARAAIARLYRARGIPLDPNQIVLCASTSEAYSWILKLLCNPGDTLLVPRPSYPLFDHIAALEAVRTKPYPIRCGPRWQIDVSSIEAEAKGARAIVLVSPHNPTGARVRRDELERIAAIGLPIICDEVFADYAEHDPAFVSSAAESQRGLVFSLGGLSKSAAMPQLKLSWIVVSGSNDLLSTATANLELIADTYLSVATPVQVAAPDLLSAGRARRAAICQRLAHNRAKLPKEAIPCPDSWMAILRAPRGKSDEDWAVTLVEQDGVLVHPGYFYDFDAEGLLVVSLLAPEVIFVEAMNRIAHRLALT